MTADGAAVLFHATDRPLELRRYPLPKLDRGEALVEVEMCTICGSDLHTFRGHRQTPCPTVLGHEILGRVAALGPGEPALALDGRPVAVGDRITWTIMASCGECFFCTHELPQKCDRLVKYGHERVTDNDPWSGGLAEYCRLRPGTGIVRLPEELPDAVACPANCATATAAAALRVGTGDRGKADEGTADQTVLVAGAGMLGLTACAMARASGAHEVIVTDVDPQRLIRANDFGATRTVLCGQEGAPDALESTVREASNGRGVDLAIELSGTTTAVESSLAQLRIGGRLVLAGTVLPTEPVPLLPEVVVRRWLSIHGVHNYAPRDLESAVDFLATHHAQFPFAGLVSEPLPLKSAAEAFQRALDRVALRVAVGRTR